MSKSVANVEVSTDTFTGWVTKTNIVLDTLTNEIVTVEGSVDGANTTGNGSVIGIFSANVLSTDNLRGGGVGNTANIATLSIGFSNSTVSSNTIITGYTANVISNTFNVSSNTSFTGANVSIVTANVAINGGNLNIISNSSFTGSSLGVSSNASFTGANTTVSNKLTADGILVVTANVYTNNTIFYSGNNSALVQTSNYYLYPGNGTESNVVCSFLLSDFKSGKMTVSAYSNANTAKRLITEVSVVYGASNVHTTEYGTVFTDTRFMTFTLTSNSTHVNIEGVSNSSVSNVNVTVLGTLFK